MNFAIANVTCEYDTSRSPSPASAPLTIIASEDHNYNAHSLQSGDSCEPPAFIIKQDNPTAILSPNNTHLNQQLLAMSRKLLAATASPQPIPDRSQATTSQQPQANRFTQQHAANQFLMSGVDLGNTKRIRRSEVLLKQAADCVSRGQTFQTVSDQFNIPISTIRFFMARKGILPRRKRGRSSAGHCPSPGPAPAQPPSPTQPPYHMAHYKLPDMDLGRVS